MRRAESPAEGSGTTPARASTTGVIVRGFPRLALNSLAPVCGFYVGDRVSGLVAGIGFASVASLVLFWWERRRGRPGILARLALVGVLLQAVLGLGSQSAFVYFLPRIAVDLAEGVAFCVSALSRRPFAWHLAREVVALPQQVVHQPDVRSLFSRITLVWGAYFILRGLVCFAVLSVSDTSTYLLTRVLVDLPVVLPLLGGSLTLGMRRFDRVRTDRVIPAVRAEHLP